MNKNVPLSICSLVGSRSRVIDKIIEKGSRYVSSNLKPARKKAVENGPHWVILLNLVLLNLVQRSTYCSKAACQLALGLWATNPCCSTIINVHINGFTTAFAVLHSVTLTIKDGSLHGSVHFVQSRGN